MSGTRISQEIRAAMVAKYLQGESARDAAAYFNRSEGSCHAALRAAGIEAKRVRQPETTAAQEAAILAAYNSGLSSREVGRRFGCSLNVVQRIAKRHGAEIHGPWRRYSVNESFFKSVDTQEKAYWLGFITADGACDNRLRVALKSSDHAHLSKFLACIGSDAPVRFRPQERHGVRTERCEITVGSAQMLRDLEMLGVGRRKSLTVQPWDGPHHLMPHYWRGVFDGDGSLSSTAGRRDGAREWQLTLVGSVAVTSAFGEFARETCGTMAKPSACRSIWAMAVRGNKKVPLLASALYTDASVYLERKYLRFHEMMGSVHG